MSCKPLKCCGATCPPGSDPEEGRALLVKTKTVVHTVLCCYNEVFEELATCFKSFQGESNWLTIDLSIYMDGHQTAEKRRKSETYAALNKLLGLSKKMSRDRWGCTVYQGVYGCAHWTLYIKGANCIVPRGKRNSHILFYGKLEERIAAGEIHRPQAILQVDADTGTEKGVAEVERMMDLLLGCPGTAAVSSTTRPANYWASWVTVMQELDYVQMRFLFGAQSFFRSVQVCIGQACLYNYDLISKRVFADGTSVLDDYIAPHDEATITDVIAETIEDSYITTCIQRAGFGTSFSLWNNFNTYVPADTTEFFGQRRRFITAAAYTPTWMYMFTTTFWTPRFFRIVFLIPMLFGQLHFLFWMGPEAIQNFHNVLVVQAYGGTPANALLTPALEAASDPHYIFMSAFAFILLFILVTMDKSSVDRPAFLLFTVVAVTTVAASTWGMWLHEATGQPDVPLKMFGVHLGVEVSSWAWLLFSNTVPLVVIYSFLTFTSFQRWPMLWLSILVGLFTGNMGSTIFMTIQHPFILAFAFANIDSRAWGTREKEGDMNEEKSVKMKQNARTLWWKKIFMLTGWLSLTFLITCAKILTPAPHAAYKGIPTGWLAGGPYQWITNFTTMPKSLQTGISYFLLFTLPVAWVLEFISQWLLIKYRENARNAQKADQCTPWSLLGPLMRLRLQSFQWSCCQDLPTYDLLGKPISK